MAAKVRVKVKYPKPDIKKTKAEIHSLMSKFVLVQLKTWVLETVNPIPVWSGAARASFLFLAEKAATSIEINPVAPDPPGSRISLGVAEANAEVITNRKKGEYGWSWESTLAHISIVESRVGFVDAGLEAIQRETPILPQPVIRTVRIVGAI